jgi:hypothetical protein
MAHASMDGKPGPHGAFLGDADQSVLGFADHRGRHPVSVAPGDKMLHTGHHAFFIAEDTAHQ